MHQAFVLAEEEGFESQRRTAPEPRSSTVNCVMFGELQTKRAGLSSSSCFAEEEGFEPPEPRSSTVFKTAAFDRSATPLFAVLQTDCKCSGLGDICQ